MPQAAKSALASAVLLILAAASAGHMLGGSVLRPSRLKLAPDLVAHADQVFERSGTAREDLEVRTPDGVLLRGWKVRPRRPNGDWVMLFHGVSDNRTGMLGYAGFLLRAGYSVLMMDARAHGASEGEMATYGWKERHDTCAIIDALFARENVDHLFALGESMGAAIALQSAATEPRIAGVVAESSFSDLREVSYDYAGLRLSPWLGKTIFRPAAFIGLSKLEEHGGFKATDVSPVKAVAVRPFPILLICGTRDHNIPCRHSQLILQGATGPKELWVVSGASHAGALGKAPAEFERRVLAFYRGIHAADDCRAGVTDCPVGLP